MASLQEVVTQPDRQLAPGQQRTVIKAMGVKQVHLEGLTATSTEHYRQRVETLKKYKPPNGGNAIDLFVARLRREDSLQLGTPGAMLIVGQLDVVLPADDPGLHAAANAVKEERLEFDDAANKAREDGIAKLLLAHKHSVVVLGGEHDLTVNLPATVEYVRVTLKAYRRQWSKPCGNSM
jgi:hypothetical protein